jgi:chromosome segregation ATPase
LENKLKENNKLKQSNKEMTVELEQLKLSNLEAEKQLKEASEKNEEELNGLRLKVKQLNKDIQSKTENIKNLMESSGKLDLDIEEGTGIVSYMKESLENLRTQKLATETEMSNIKADIIKTENLIPTVSIFLNMLFLI